VKGRFLIWCSCLNKGDNCAEIKNKKIGKETFYNNKKGQGKGQKTFFRPSVNMQKQKTQTAFKKQDRYDKNRVFQTAQDGALEA
jgi:hypothetical protein